MSNSVEFNSPKEWEKYCETMLRNHYTHKHFWKVPDEDQGDAGIEFFTADGTIFQCYLPDSKASMADYKKKIQKKINDDLKKLDENREKIKSLLDEIKIDTWVLLTPEMKSKELIAYCNKKRKEVIAKDIPYIIKDTFKVKIETADSYPDSKLFANMICSNQVNIPEIEITDEQKTLWKENNSNFIKNINRKSLIAMGDSCVDFKEQVIEQYLRIDDFLQKLRYDYPDIFILIENSARSRLSNIKEEALFWSLVDKNKVFDILNKNREHFKKHESIMSDVNIQLLSFGYLSKWIAECYMSFIK